MKIVSLLLSTLLLLCYQPSHGEVCENTPECQQRLYSCRHASSMLTYEECLTDLCKHCRLCNLCDGKSYVIRGTMAQRFQCLSAHNKLRRLHVGTPPLEWDADLARESQEHAEMLVNSLSFKHGADGENMFLKCGSNGTTVQSCNEASKAWYSEIQDYDYSIQMSRNENPIGHFAQVVWKDNRKIGVGIAVHKETKFVFVIARYENYVDKTKMQNVQPKKQV